MGDGKSEWLACENPSGTPPWGDGDSTSHQQLQFTEESSWPSWTLTSDIRIYELHDAILILAIIKHFRHLCVFIYLCRLHRSDRQISSPIAKITRKSARRNTDGVKTSFCAKKSLPQIQAKAHQRNCSCHPSPPNQPRQTSHNHYQSSRVLPLQSVRKTLPPNQKKQSLQWRNPA